MPMRIKYNIWISTNPILSFRWMIFRRHWKEKIIIIMKIIMKINSPLSMPFYFYMATMAFASMLAAYIILLATRLIFLKRVLISSHTGRDIFAARFEFGFQSRYGILCMLFRHVASPKAYFSMKSAGNLPSPEALALALASASTFISVSGRIALLWSLARHRFSIASISACSIGFSAFIKKQAFALSASGGPVNIDEYHLSII